MWAILCPLCQEKENTVYILLIRILRAAPAHLLPVIIKHWSASPWQDFSLFLSLCMSFVETIPFPCNPHAAALWFLQPYFEGVFLRNVSWNQKIPFPLSDIFRNAITQRCSSRNLDTPIIWSYCCPSEKDVLFPEQVIFKRKKLT